MCLGFCSICAVLIMDYGSSHVYLYEHSDEEVVYDEEFKEGMWLR